MKSQIMSQQIASTHFVSISKDQIINMLLNINRNLLKKFIVLKQSFVKAQIPNNQISNTFKTWKPIFEEIVQNQFSKLSREGQKINQKDLLMFMTQRYSYDQQYIEAIKNMNSTTEMIKQFIRINAIRDPTTNP